MTYSLKYLVSFACALFLFCLSVVFSNLLSGEMPFFNSNQWLAQKSSIEILTNFFTIQILAVIFTFAFWTESKEFQKWMKAPFRFSFRLLVLFSFFSFFLYGLREYLLTDISREFYALQENRKTVSRLKTDLLKLRAQKGYLEERLARVEEENDKGLYLKLAYADVLSLLMHLYSQYATIENSEEMQKGVQVAQRAIQLNRADTERVELPIVPFNSLTSREMILLYRSFEKQRDYITALYFIRLLKERDSKNPFYVKEEGRLRSILDNPEASPQVEEVRSAFISKQRCYMDFKMGMKLEAFYGIQSFLQKFPEDRDAEELFKRIDQAVRQEYIFYQDIIDSFEMGGARATLLLNENTGAYREYVYLGKIVGFGSRIVIRDIAIIRMHPNKGLSLYLKLPYASFDQNSSSLVFNVIDSKTYNSYLDPVVERGTLDPLPKEWKINYPLEVLPAFSLVRLSSLTDLSFFQVWKAFIISREKGDKEQASVFFYTAFERLLAPLGFILISLWLTGLFIKYPVISTEKAWGMIFLVIASPTIGALLTFFFYNFVALATFFLVNSLFGMILLFAFVFFLIGSAFLRLSDAVRKRVG